MYGSLEPGDIEEGLAIASRIGDDYLQKKARGYTVPESFNHGTSAQRQRWLKKGATTGDIRQGDIFSPPTTSCSGAYFLLVMMSRTILSVSCMPMDPRRVRLWIQRSTSSSIRPSTLLTE